MLKKENEKPLLEESDSDCEEDIFIKYEPPDRYNLVYIVFYLLGISSLLPWNFFLTADDYWLYKFRNVSSNLTVDGHMVVSRTPLQASFMSYVCAAPAVPYVIVLLLNVLMTNRISTPIRIIGSLTGMLALVMMTLIFVVVDTDNRQEDFFILTLVSIVFLNMFSAVLGGSVFGAAGQLPSQYMTAASGGQALGAVFAAISQLVSLSLGASPISSALMYFIIANTTLLVALLGYVVMIKTDFYRYHKYHQKSSAKVDLLKGEIFQKSVSFTKVFQDIWILGTALCLIFLFKLPVYPAVAILVESENKGKNNLWNDVYFVPTICFLLFNICDYFGRILAGKIQKPENASNLLMLSFLRIIFIPLVMFCNAQPRYHLPVLFGHDYEYIIIIIAFALTNGYVANLVSIWAPRLVKEHEKEAASSMMIVFMGVGVAVGSFITVIMVKLL